MKKKRGFRVTETEFRSPFRIRSLDCLLLIEIMGWSMDLVVRQIRSAPSRYLAALKSPDWAS